LVPDFGNYRSIGISGISPSDILFPIANYTRTPPNATVSSRGYSKYCVLFNYEKSLPTRYRKILIKESYQINIYSRNDMELSILKELRIVWFPSGSGVSKHGEHYFAIGDDSPFLFTINKEFQIIDRKLLIENPPSEKRILKAEKPDFEALELINSKCSSVSVCGKGFFYGCSTFLLLLFY